MADVARAPGAVLVEGDTCWRIARAERAAVLVDGEAYFAALADALERAERSILLLGWDLHGGMRLRRGEDGDDGPTLVQFLDGLVRRRRGLHAHVLEWDFALLYTLERQLLPRVRFGLATHRRLHFQLDAEHPLGGSQHQKLVVVDDRIAFCGGLDLSVCRWDTREHRAGDARRCDPGARDYPAFHDVQMLVDGPAAAALGDLARWRWRRATGQRLGRRRGIRDPWPPGVAPIFRGVDVGIARTLPAARRHPAVREVERLFLASIRAARRAIYVENQYLTSSAIGEALAARLAEADGPDVVIVSTGTCEGWLEERTMGVLRARWLARLRAADRHGRLRVLQPIVPGLAPGNYTVHAKVMVVDDRLLRVGSANLSNRSMGLDSECDLAIEARGDEAAARAIAGVRDDLLAEHLGVSPKRVAEEVVARGSLCAAVDALRGGPRTLAPIECELDPLLDELVPDAAVLDPEKPVGPDELMQRLLPELAPPERRETGVLSLALAVVAVGAAWRFTPLSEWASPERLAALAEPLRAHAAGPPLVALAIAAASLALVPISALAVGSALVFGPLLGFAAAYAGALGSAALGFAIGRSLWGGVVQRLVGRRLRRLRAPLARRGVLAAAALRILPLAPFAVVNLAAGASPMRFRDYLLGSALGLLPLLALLVLLAESGRRALLEPGYWTFAGATALALAGWATLVWARRRVARQGVREREAEHGQRGSAPPELRV
jgi:phosphatidylserine/phosphatidylglycerophosphate/cardiolipin synthase-like enzyme/uncharacterized membrane protein YdjX (TVP38/TMEM64 family)